MTLGRGNHTDMAMCSETEEFRGELGGCGIARIYTLPKPHHYRVLGRCIEHFGTGMHQGCNNSRCSEASCILLHFG